MSRETIVMLGGALLWAVGGPVASAQGFDTLRPAGASAGDRFTLVPDAASSGDSRFQPGFRLTTDYTFAASSVLLGENFPTATVFTQFSAAVVLAQRLNLELDQPVRFETNGDVAMYDTRIRIRQRFLGGEDDPVSMAVDVGAWLPTGDPAKFTGDEQARYMGRLITSGTVFGCAYASYLGYLHRSPAVGATWRVGPSALFGFAVGRALYAQRFYIGAEIAGSSVLPLFDPAASPLEGRLSGQIHIKEAYIGAYAGRSLPPTPGTPNLSVGMVVVFEPPVGFDDDDGDGVRDRDDACPSTAGVIVEARGTAGCPLDSDGDSVTDDADSCPATNGDGPDGCPSDTDEDGIIDIFDGCPDAAGPPQARPAQSGCPLPHIDQLLPLPASPELLDPIAATMRDFPELGTLLITVRAESHDTALRQAETIRAWLAINGQVHGSRLQVAAEVSTDEATASVKTREE